MALFLISYDLEKPDQNRNAVHKLLDSWYADRVLESTWMLRTHLTANEMRDALIGAEGPMDAKDRLVVVKVAAASTYGTLIDPRVI